MVETTMPAGAGPAVVRRLSHGDLRDVLALGWRDFRAAPQFGLFFAAVYVAGGWLLLWALGMAGQVFWTIPVTLGFPLLGPFVAVGLYEVSRLLERGAPMRWGAVLGAIARERDRQIPTLAAVIVVYFLFWNFVAHMIFALFLGLQVMTHVSSSWAVFLTVPGLAMITIGTLVGAGFAAVLFALTVIALPLLLDREVDFVTAMLTSLAVVRANPTVMLRWGVTISVVLFVAMVPGFLGLFVALPVLGHASWHLYRRALEPDTGAGPAP
jgi:uncharacterized membrane protein